MRVRGFLSCGGGACCCVGISQAWARIAIVPVWAGNLWRFHLFVESIDRHLGRRRKQLGLG